MEIRNALLSSFAGVKLQERLQFRDEHRLDASRGIQRIERKEYARKRRETVRPVRHEARYLSSAYNYRGQKTPKVRADAQNRRVDIVG